MTKAQELVRWLVERKVIILVVLILIGIYLYFNQQGGEDDLLMEMGGGLLAQEKTQENAFTEDEKAPSSFTHNAEKIERTEMKVDVKGAVHNPGVYQITEEERVIDVIQKAGGLTEEADDSQINLSQKVFDEMVIYIPKVGEESPIDLVSQGPVNHGQGNDSGKININTADQVELETLNGIGATKAKAIIDYRDKNGSFKNIEDIMNVSGIGEKSFEKIKDDICVN